MWKSLLLLPALMVGVHLPANAAELLPGMTIPVRIDSGINVNQWDRGRIYPAHVSENVYERDGDLAIPRGSYAEMIVRDIGPGQYTIDLESVTVNGQRYALDTAGPQYNMPQPDYNSGNGVLGAIAGAIAGAAGAQVESSGSSIHIPAGTMLTVSLREPLHVVTWGDPGYEHGGYHYHHDRDWYR